MSLDVFNKDLRVIDFGAAKAVLERRLEAKLIKQRDAGNGVKLDYIGGHTVIRLLNEAFGYTWSFEIVQDEIIESQPKPVVKWENKKRVPQLNADGTPKVEAQPPVVKVLGRLTVPGYGIKEQYGSKVLIGGASEQEAAFKSASTDALKKCATMFGIGLELYEDDDETPQGFQQATTQPQQNSWKDNQGAQNVVPMKPAAQTQSAPTPQGNPTVWDQADVNKLKELKAIVGITDNNQLDSYVREFTDDQAMTYLNIGPHNIKAFNIFMAKKAEMV